MTSCAGPELHRWALSARPGRQCALRRSRASPGSTLRYADTPAWRSAGKSATIRTVAALDAYRASPAIWIRRDPDQVQPIRLGGGRLCNQVDPGSGGVVGHTGGTWNAAGVAEVPVQGGTPAPTIGSVAAPTLWRRRPTRGVRSSGWLSATFVRRSGRSWGAAGALGPACDEPGRLSGLGRTTPGMMKPAPVQAGTGAGRIWQGGAQSTRPSCSGRPRRSRPCSKRRSCRCYRSSKRGTRPCGR